jgi:hypothetical protein
MAYGRKYLVEFLNVQNDVHHVYISEKDYLGNVAALRGEANVFSTNYGSGDDGIFSKTPIRAKECTLNFTAENGVSLKNFYTDDDEQFRIDHYCHSVNGVVIDQLIASYFLVPSNCEQPYLDSPFPVSLKGTDNLALIKNVPFTSEGMDYHPADGSQYIGKISLYDLFVIAINSTGLNDLRLRVYSNIFENTTTDRSTDLTAEMLQETYIFNGMYLNDDNSWQDMYSIIQNICLRFELAFHQDNGAWNVTRRQESYLFADNKIKGVEHSLSDGSKTAIELDYNWPVKFGSDIFLDKADHVESINVSLKYAKETFMYRQPKQLIRNLDLQTLGALIRQYTDGSGNLVAEYEMPYWTKTSFSNINEYFIRVVTKTTGLEVEQERYAVLKGGTFGGPHVMSSSFYLDTNDRVQVSFQIRTSDSQTGSSNVVFVFQTDTGTQKYKINFNNGTTQDGTWATNGGAIFSYSSQSNLQDWTTFTVTSLAVPVDGYFSFGLDQADFKSPINETHYMDFQLTHVAYINDSTEIIGQYHLTDQNLLPGKKIKNDYDAEIFMDDSPKHAIEGALFTDALVNGDYNQLTATWHRATNDEALRLGQITTYERMHNAFKPRMALEGTLYGLRHLNSSNQWNFVSLLCLLTLDSSAGLNFVFGVLEVDWMNATYKAKINELYADDADNEVFDYTYTFQYIYKTS